MTRRFATLVVLALLAAACGGSDESDAATGADASGSSEATDTASSDTPDPQPDDPEPEPEASPEDDEPDPEPDDTDPAPEPVFPRTVTDALGNEFVLDQPARIGCAWTGCDELHATLGVVIGAGAPLAGYEDSPMFYPLGPPSFIPSNVFDVEDWSESGIDFVLRRVPEDPFFTNLEAVVNVFHLHHPSYGDSTSVGFQAYLDNLDLVGRLLGREAEAAAAIERLQTMVDDLTAMSTPETRARTVAILFPGDGYQVIGDENPFCDVLALTGLGDCLDYGTVEIGAEAMLQEDPDWIIYQGGAESSTEDRTDPTWERLTAVQAGQVIDSRFGQYYCCGDRTLVFGLQEFVAASLSDSGIPAPGDPTTFDPDTSPLFG
ncbi:MAG: ABC transporter substrate-binding protein [Actinomycetota bacterium]